MSKAGLPRGAARNVMDALSVMKRAGVVPAPVAAEADRRAVPAIIFHGDADQTVHPRNGENVLAASVARGGTRYAPAADSPHVEQGESGRGRRYTRSVYRDTAGKVHAEYWLVHGAGHAWSGGDADGSYTDNLGPDATRAMLQFFFDQSKANALN